MTTPQPDDTGEAIDEIVLKPAQWQYDDYVKAKARLHELIRGEVKLCEVCRQKPAVRRGVERRGDVALTFGYFCDTCVAYPGHHAIQPDNFELQHGAESGEA